ncbi:MAG: hypothetical protein LBB42_05505 [Coriobacteriales bacterium]|jgi:hypothetical protein|nr:hypothetical protein [Coriobacteriales bacterium]
MHLRDYLSLVAHEIKLNLTSYLSFILIICIFFSTGISMILLTEKMPEVFKSQVPDEWRYDQSIYFKHASHDDFSTLTEMGLRDVRLEFEKQDKLGGAYSFFHKKRELEKPTQITCVNFATKQFVGVTLVKGNLWTSEANNPDNSDPTLNPVWVSEEYRKTNKLVVGDIIKLQGNNNYSFSIAGSYKISDEPFFAYDETEEMPEFLFGDDPQMLISFNAGALLLEGAGLSTLCDGTATISDEFDHPTYSAKLLEMGILTYGSTIEALLEQIAFVEYFLLALFIVLNLIGLLLLASFISIAIKKRTPFLGMLKALGTKDYVLAILYLIIMEIILCLALVLAFVFGYLLYLLIAGKIGQFYEIGSLGLNTINLRNILLAVAVPHAFMLLAWALAFQKIRNIDVLRIITNRD